MAERHSRLGIDPNAPVVGPAMAEAVGHARRNIAQFIGPEASFQVYQARNPAHSRSFIEVRLTGAKLPLSMLARKAAPLQKPASTRCDFFATDR